MASLADILNWWDENVVPIVAQRMATFSSFRHKDDLVPMSEVEGLEDAINSKPSTIDFNTAIATEATIRAAADTALAADIATKVSKWQQWENLFVVKDTTTGNLLFNVDTANGLVQMGDFTGSNNSTFISLDDAHEVIIVNAANGLRGPGGTYILNSNGDAKFANATISSLTSTMLKVNSAGKLVAAVAGTDYQTPIGYSPVNKGGDTMLGYLTLVGDAVNALHPITKSQFDNLQTGLSWKYSARASTVTALPSYTISGDFLTLTATSNGALTIDGITLAVGDRILVKNEAGAARVNNGGYTVTQAGSAATKWCITRTTGVTTNDGLNAATFYVREGTVEANRIYAVNTNPVTLGTTQITFALVAGAGTYANGSGIDLTGNVFSIANAGVTNAMLAGGIADAKISSAANWNTAYNSRISNFTTTGNSGAASFAGNVLNIPNYTLAGLGGLPLVGGDLTGTAGAGFHGFISQSSAPATPSSGFRLYADATNRFAWKGANGFVRTFDGTANTADRNYTLPDASGTLPLLNLAQTWSATQSISNGNSLFIYNTTDQISNYERLRIYTNGSLYQIISEAGGTGTARSINLSAGTIFISGTLSASTISNANILSAPTNGTISLRNTWSQSGGSAGVSSGTVEVVPTINQTGTAGYTGFRVAVYEQSLGSNTKRLISFGNCTAANGGGTYTEYLGLSNLGILNLNGSMVIGSSSAIASAQLAMVSTTQGFLPPRMTKTQRDAIASPAIGLEIYQTDNTPGKRVFNGTNWMRYTETTD